MAKERYLKLRRNTHLPLTAFTVKQLYVRSCFGAYKDPCTLRCLHSFASLPSQGIHALVACAYNGCHVVADTSTSWLTHRNLTCRHGPQILTSRQDNAIGPSRQMFSSQSMQHHTTAKVRNRSTKSVMVCCSRKALDHKHQSIRFTCCCLWSCVRARGLRLRWRSCCCSCWCGHWWRS